ncbi:MAG TPA: LamG-like jellyroll fold domain-containing protein, partial [Clostridia bacterium]|nr:LamG-like jellyroll fold domain-containing protein [Clostridia bacterium]
IRLVSTTNNLSTPDVYFGPDHSANSFWGARLESAVDLGESQRLVFGKTGHNGVGKYGLTGADCQFAGTIIGTGGLTIVGQNSWTASEPMEVPFALNASNAFTGPLEIRRGSVYLGNKDALRRGNALVFNPANGHNARLFLYGNDATVSDLSSAGGGSAIIANGNMRSGVAVTLGPVTLEVIQHTDTVFGGSISDVCLEYAASGSGTSGPLSLRKTGPGTLRLTGVNTYGGSTVISNGTLQVDGVLGAGAVTVWGGNLSGGGQISGAVNIENGGVLTPGVAGAGTLTVNNSVALSGGALMEVSKVGTALVHDQVAGATVMTFGGSLQVTNIGDVRTGALLAGDTFGLFAAGSYEGSFSSVQLPELAADLTWDTANLVVDGSITVVATNGAPLITAQPVGGVTNTGAAVVLRVGAAGPRPMAYEWCKDSAPVPGATGSVLTIANCSTNDSGAYTVRVINAFGSVTSSVAILSLLPAGVATPVTNNLVVYLNFDGNLNAQAGTTNPGSLYKGGATMGPRYGAGVIGQAASFANSAVSTQPNDWAVSLGNLEWVYAGSFSVSFWEKTRASGDDALMGNKNWTSGANVGWVISALDQKNLNYNAVGGTRRDIDLQPPMTDGGWHLITVTFNRNANQVTSYVDGVPMNTSDISPSGSASLNAGLSTLVGSSGNGLYSAFAEVDDLGIWTRVLTPEEVTGIYGAGLAGKPLILAMPGQAPSITTQPLHFSTTPGQDAVFTVAASGPGTLVYQWKLNGTNLPGATNATLVLSGVTPAQAGTYSVLVSNGSGAVASVGVTLAIYPLQVTGQWDFEFGDLRASAGSDLEYRGNTSLQTSFPFMNINGRAARVMRFGAGGAGAGYYLRHGAKPNGGGSFVNQYTLILDVMFPASSNGELRPLLQTNPFNPEGNEAEFFVGPNNGIGAEGEFSGALVPGTWHRIVFAVDLCAAAGPRVTKYVDGVPVGVQQLAEGADGRYALGAAAVLFASGMSENLGAAGYVNSLQLANGCMSAEAIAALGGPDADGLPSGNAVFKIQSLGQNPSTVTLRWTGPDGVFQVQRSSSLTNPLWQEVASYTNLRSVTLPVTGPTSFYRLKQYRPDILVGQLPHGEQSLPSKQVLRPAGRQVSFGGRPVDLALSPDGTAVYIKNLNNLLVVDAKTWAVRQTLSYPGSGASMHGIAVRPDGTRVYVTGAGNELYEWGVATNGVAAFLRTIAMPTGSYPCGLALSPDGARAYVCLSVANKLAVVDLASGGIIRQINTGIAPWDVVLSPDGQRAFVSDWGGRFPVSGDLTAPSAGTQVVVDARGVAVSGVVSFVDLVSGVETAQITAGLHPSDLELNAAGTRLYVANANSDTVSVIDTQAGALVETILVRPDPEFPYGSAGNGLALSRDGKQLFVASAGNNAVAVVELPNGQHTNSVVKGFLPTDWYPGAVVTDSNHIYVVNVKGLGTRQGQPLTTAWSIGAFLGTANKLELGTQDALAKHTAQAFEQGRISHIRQAREIGRPNQAAVPVPRRLGEPSVFKHVVYILKENKTYDQMFGDMPEGNGEPNLCIYPEYVSPNHHVLAREYVLLDNFYCNGVNSADGHSWSTEGNVTDHLEKSFGGFTRSYTFGDDPLTYSSTGFIWNNVLQHGLTFRNYGEMDYASTSPARSWLQIYQDYTNGTGAIRYVQNIGIASLRPYSSTNVPGWNMAIPDVVRAAGFIKELTEAQARGVWQDFHLLYLPNDHTGGPPTPRAQVADNDLALGQVVEAITRSTFWSDTVVFVIEDDPQSGYDHVDAHRSICLVISPYTKRGQVISTFYNQAGVLHTMQRILGIPPMNQQDAMAPLMFECFTEQPNYTPYAVLPNNIPLTEGVSGTAAMSAKDKYWAKKKAAMDLSGPDRIDDDLFNRYIWYTIKGDAPFPAKFVGGHGRGLKRLGLELDASAMEDDDD